MNFTLTSEQEQLRELLRAFLADRNDFEARMRVSRSTPGWSAELWSALAVELGVLGASLPESAGGLGGTAADVKIIMEEFGASLLLEPYLETVVIAGGLLSAAGARDADLARIVQGEARFALAWAETAARYRFEGLATSAERVSDGWMISGKKSAVSAAPWATDLLVTARTSGLPGDREGVSVFLVDPAAAGVDIDSYSTIDGRRAAEIAFDRVLVPAGALVGSEGNSLPLVEMASDQAMAALAAEAVGVMRRLVHDTIEFTKQRRQFGQAISSFQAIQHRLVDMHMHLELATSAAYLATLALDEEPIERAKSVAAAKVTIGRALRFVGENAVQLHGGMGMTDELPIGHYFKRGMVIESEFGGTDYQLSRYTKLTQAA